MNSFEDMDFEDILNNPLKNVDMQKNKLKSTNPQKQALSELKKAQKLISSWKETASDADLEPMEKNIISLDKKLDTLKSIIEHQNNIISLLEEELDIIWKHLGCENQKDEFPGDPN